MESFFAIIIAVFYWVFIAVFVIFAVVFIVSCVTKAVKGKTFSSSDYPSEVSKNPFF